MLDQLNPEQRSAVLSRGHPLLVLAGAGSGKTKTLTERMAKLLEEGVSPGAIAAITFTNKAAKEMRQRLSARVGKDRAAAVSVCTFHALGLKLLQIEAQYAGLRSGFSILDSGDSDSLFNDLAPQGMGRDTVSKLRHRVHQAKSAGLRPNQVAGDGAEGAEVQRLYAGYQARLSAFNAVDFDDLIVRPLWLLEDHPEVAERWCRRYVHLLVDEYQDTNPAQYRLLRILAGDGSGLAVVGDDDQSIYGWRGADPRNMFRLDQDFPQLQVVKLERNYRCAPRILKIANALIANNPHMIEKKLWSGLPECPPIRIARLPEVEEEARWVVMDIADRHNRQGVALDAFAILYRSHHLSRHLEVALRERDLSYRIRGGAAFFDRPEVKDLLAYMRIIGNPGDDSAFLRAVRSPRRGIGEATLAKLSQVAAQRHGSLSQAAAESHSGDRGAQALHRFAADLARWRAASEHLGPGDLLTKVTTDIGWDAHVRGTRGEPSTLQRRLDFSTELARMLGERGRGMQALAGRLSELAINRDDRDDDGEGIQLLTLHAAKGLEFDRVYLIGLDEGTLPHESSMDDNRLEEERRLLYVGLTRARQELTLSYPRIRTMRGESYRTKASRFLGEFPDDDVARDAEKGPADPEERRARARSRLDEMRALLEE